MKDLKYYGLDIRKESDHGIAISFKVDNVVGVDLIVNIFNAGKAIVNNRIFSGSAGARSFMDILYSWINIGKIALFGEGK